MGKAALSPIEWLKMARKVRNGYINGRIVHFAAGSLLSRGFRGSAQRGGPGVCLAKEIT